VEVLLAKARLAGKSGNNAEAERLYDTVLKDHPRNTAALTGKAVLRDVAGDKKAAAEHYKVAILLDQDNVQAMNNLAMIYADEKGRGPVAYNLAARAYAISGGKPGVADTLGYVLLRNGRADEALKVLEKAVSVAPDNPYINYHIAMALAELGEHQQALASVDKALQASGFPQREQAGQLRQALLDK
jgi:Flp pilus assembly protein TadD